MLKVDLHLHTAEDPLDNVRHDAIALIDRAAQLGFGALAITLHDRQLWERYTVDYARERGIVLLRGVERTVAGRHVLMINFPASVEQVRSFDDIAHLRRRCSGLVIAPHPFFPSGCCLGRLLDTHADLFDAVEWSYFWMRGLDFNRRAAHWAERHGKPVVGNSDLHDLRQFGRTYSLVAADPDADAICEAVRAGAVSVVTAPVPPVELALVMAGLAWRGRKPRTTRITLATDNTG